MPEFLYTSFLGQATWIWLVFVSVVVALLAFDLGILHSKDREIGVSESLMLSARYISAAMLFGGWLWWMVHRFAYLKFALALVLIFIGGKIFLANRTGKIPPLISLGVTLSVILGGIVVSLWKTRGQQTPALASDASISSASN